MKGKRWVPWLLMAAVVTGAFICGPGHGGHHSPTERARDIAAGVRCPTCAGESALESQAPISIAIRTEIGRRIAAGESDTQIRSFLVSRYGQSILLKPPTGGLTGLVWILPGLVLVFAAFGATRAVRRWGAGPGSTPPSLDDQVMVSAAVSECASRSPRRPRSDSHSGLEEQRSYLLASLARIEEERASGDLDEATYHALRDDTTARAAALFHQIERAGPARPQIQPEAAKRRRWLPAIAVGTIVVVGSSVLIAGTVHPRAGGQTATGSITRLSSDPLGDARRLAQQGKNVDAMKQYDAILANDPKQPEALAYRGALLALSGETSVGLTSIERAIAADPTYPVAHYLRGLLLSQQGDRATAAAEFRATLADNPAPDISAATMDALNQLQTPGAQSAGAGTGK